MDASFLVRWTRTGPGNRIRLEHSNRGQRLPWSSQRTTSEIGRASTGAAAPARGRGGSHITPQEGTLGEHLPERLGRATTVREFYLSRRRTLARTLLPCTGHCTPGTGVGVAAISLHRKALSASTSPSDLVVLRRSANFTSRAVGRWLGHSSLVPGYCTLARPGAGGCMGWPLGHASDCQRISPLEPEGDHSVAPAHAPRSRTTWPAPQSPSFVRAIRPA